MNKWWWVALVVVVAVAAWLIGHDHGYSRGYIDAMCWATDTMEFITRK